MILRKIYKYGTHPQNTNVPFKSLSNSHVLNCSLSLIWANQRRILMRNNCTLNSLNSHKFNCMKGNLESSQLHLIPAAFLNKRQIRKHKEKDQRKARWATATFNKNEELKKLITLGTEHEEKEIINIYTPQQAIEEIKNQPKHKVDESIDI